MTNMLWDSRGNEYRQISKDCVAMGRPDLAAAFLALAEQEERYKHALGAIFGSSATERDPSR
jgi:hypothetical protein